MADRDMRSEPSSARFDRPGTSPAKDQTGSFAADAAAPARVLDEIEPRVPIGVKTTPGDSAAVFKITSPGSYYLTADVAGEPGKSGIEISASRVVLDLMGFALIGVTASEDGILVSAEATDVAIRGGVARDWGRNGLNLATVSDGRYQDIVASANKLNGLLCGERSAIVDCSAQGNGEFGIQAGDGSTVRTCAAHDNPGSGIQVGRESMVSDSLARGNSIYGIATGQGCTIRGGTAGANQLAGIAAQDGCTIVGCTASLNDADGIILGSSSTVSNCTMSSNGGDGIKTGEGTTVSGCTICGNGGTGIQISGHSRIAGNVCDSNSAAGIHVTGSDSIIESNSGVLK